VFNEVRATDNNKGVSISLATLNFSKNLRVSFFAISKPSVITLG